MVDDRLAAFRRGKYLSLESFRADGSAVSTPVWFVLDEDRLFCRSAAESFKVKRIRQNPSVTVAPCGLRGKVKGAKFSARVEMVPEGDWPRLDRRYAQKYRLEGFLSRLPGGGGPPAPEPGSQLYYEIIPEHAP